MDQMITRGKVVVITGASRGLGAGLARAMQAEGLRLALCARGEPALADSPDVLSTRLDVTDEAAVNRFTAEAVDRFSRIDLWINNAGVLDPIAPLRDVDASAFWRHMEINLLGVFHGTQAFVRHLRSRAGDGVLLNISSGAARKAYHGWSPYCAAKAAVDRLTECVQIEEASAGLRAHAVAPGVIDTDMQASIRRCTPEQFAEVERFRQMKQANAFATPEFVARELLSLAFDPSRRSSEVLVRLPAA